jgi:hypothetical protein
MIHLPTATTYGTSFHNTTFKSTPNQLIKAIGEITYKGSGDKKNTMEWVRELDSADVFTIYDWKYYKEIEMDEEIEWNIGGNNKFITEQAKKEILELLKK